MNTTLSRLVNDMSQHTLLAINNFVSVTGYVYGVVNLVAPSIQLSSDLQQEQTDYDQFKKELEFFKQQAGLWIQPDKQQSNDLVTMITALPSSILPISAALISDLSTLKTLKPGQPVDSTFLIDAQEKVGDAKQTIAKMCLTARQFINSVETIGKGLQAASDKMLSSIDNSLKAELTALKVSIETIEQMVEQKQRKIDSNDTGRDISIAVTVVSIFTFGLGGAVVGAAGIALSSAEIQTLKDEIKSLNLKISQQINALNEDQQAQTAVILFNQQIQQVLKAQGNAMQSLQVFYSFLDSMEQDILAVQQDIMKLSTERSPLLWKLEIEQVIDQWTALKNLAMTLSQIKINVNPYIFDGNTVKLINGSMWLNGDTTTGAVNGTTFSDDSGTRWQVAQLPNGNFTLQCLSEPENQNHVFLNGHTQTGLIELSTTPSPTNPLSGTQWYTEDLGNGFVTLKCMGRIINQEHAYLSLDPQNHVARLVSKAALGQPQTQWKIDPA